MKKIMKAVLFVIFLIAAITAIMLYVQLNTIIKAAVETVGPKITQTTVKLSSVSLRPFSGKGSIRGLVIGNPKGFKSKDAFELKKVQISLEPKSLTTNKIVIREISIDGPEITYEINRSGNNLQAIQKNIAAFAPASSSNSKTAKGPEKKFEIDLFVLKNAKVRVLSYLLGGTDHVISLPDIRLENIGRGPEGATAKEAVSAIFKSITQGVLKAIANAGQLLKGATQALGETQKTIKGFKVKGLFGP